MSTLYEHCSESLKIFGKDFTEVHIWLDEFAGTPKYSFRHRRRRHHEAGIRQVAEIFGVDTAPAQPAARQHIITDLKQECWTESDRFPLDEADYVKMGLF